MAKKSSPKAKSVAAAPVEAGATVKVKFLRDVGAHKRGDVVDLPAEIAEHVLKPTQVHDGQEIQETLKAVRVEDFGAFENKEMHPRDIAKMTAHEMRELGLRNIVVTPIDPEFEKHLAKVKEQDADDEGGDEGGDEDKGEGQGE